ncbi:hypothetical protein QYE76_065147 [Lolium multiflorum]|uniref:Retrotransposon gag domain-containing protein n=1 Tax=Lolium multiflorum TaxID=4521 RepID=A0AAD8WAX8_LOLMU|nr:hypothetical protein QYE76_065147 [Lolium multiflorum]
MENYSLLMGAAALMKMAVEMAAVSMEKPSGGTSPSGREQRLLSPRSWLRDGGGSGSLMKGFFKPSDVLPCTVCIMNEIRMAPPSRASQDAMMQLLQTLMADREAERAERQANIAALQQIAQTNQGHGNHDHPGSKLKNFQNTNPLVFSKTEEPLDADDWLQTMENNLEVAGVEANDKVLFATHYLAGPARAWWSSARALNAGQMMTWADFKLKFSKYHVPPGLIKKMRDEFRELKQGRMTVVEYRDKFLTLSRYAPDEMDTTEKRKERFLNGLHDEMHTVLVNIPFADLEALVDSSATMEDPQ